MLLGRQCFRYISVERAVENQSSKKLFQCDSWIKLVEKIVIYQRMIPRILFFTRVSSIGVFKKEGETFKYMVMYLQDGVGRGGVWEGGEMATEYGIFALFLYLLNMNRITAFQVKFKHDTEGCLKSPIPWCCFIDIGKLTK